MRELDAEPGAVRARTRDDEHAPGRGLDGDAKQSVMRGHGERRGLAGHSCDHQALRTLGYLPGHEVAKGMLVKPVPSGDERGDQCPERAREPIRSEVTHGTWLRLNGDAPRHDVSRSLEVGFGSGKAEVC